MSFDLIHVFFLLSRAKRRRMFEERTNINVTRYSYLTRLSFHCFFSNKANIVLRNTFADASILKFQLSQKVQVKLLQGMILKFTRFQN